MRRVLIAAVAAVLVLACGITGYLLARPGDHTDPDQALPPPPGADPRSTYAVHGRAHSCLTSGELRLSAEVRDATDATFVLDGAEIASARATAPVEKEPGPYEEIPAVRALMPRWAEELRCDDGATHHLEIYTARPDGCRITVTPGATFAEGRNHAMGNNTEQLPDGVCALTLHD